MNQQDPTNSVDIVHKILKSGWKEIPVGPMFGVIPVGSKPSTYSKEIKPATKLEKHVYNK